MFAVASDAYEDKLPSATGVAVFWKQLISPLFQFLGCLEAVLTVGSSKKPLVFRTALRPTACRSVADCSVMELDKGNRFLLFTFFYFGGGCFICTIFLRIWGSSAELWGVLSSFVQDFGASLRCWKASAT